MPFPRLIEARSIITHGLGEAGSRHEAYMEEFRQMVAQVERLYPLWLIDRGKPAEDLIAMTAHITWNQLSHEGKTERLREALQALIEETRNSHGQELGAFSGLEIEERLY